MRTLIVWWQAYETHLLVFPDGVTVEHVQEALRAQRDAYPPDLSYPLAYVTGANVTLFERSTPLRYMFSTESYSPLGTDTPERYVARRKALAGNPILALVEAEERGE